MDYLGLKDSERYEAYLRERLQYDPLKNCGQIQSRLSIVISLEDSSVPTANQLKLLDSCNPQRVKKLDSGHVRGVFDLLLNKREIRHFFERPE